ncbi:hypothetical protein Hhis01_03157 [Haloarcula hispanica]
MIDYIFNNLKRIVVRCLNGAHWTVLKLTVLVHTFLRCLTF